MITSIVYHFLVIIHHSHHDFSIWQTYYTHPLAHKSAAFMRIYAWLKKAGI